MQEKGKSGLIRNSRLTNNQAAALLLAFCLSAVIIACLAWKGIRAYCEYRDRFYAYDALIREAGIRNGVDPALLKAVIWRESRFDKRTIGSKGEIGLMQLMPSLSPVDWAKAHKRSVPSRGVLMDPELNIEIGSWFLGRALKRWQSYQDCAKLALCEYNAGYQRANAWKPPKKTDSMDGRIKIQSTRLYVDSILKKQREYDKEFRMLNEVKK